ncbi:hypothetical protein CPB84DRAFT_1827250 [Gymnopilus junonius]|uniref:Uncharacterized protein n=1 Tax=Gymnopilus junonius TaxID=109634 RepID=A0A9P5TIQ5_GYMJU|nr:hypothetical protein CPB84DRAFT_1827250 [Gymnopilus junonius]
MLNHSGCPTKFHPALLSSRLKILRSLGRRVILCVTPPLLSVFTVAATNVDLSCSGTNKFHVPLRGFPPDKYDPVNI